jgi:hypothetical protein
VLARTMGLPSGRAGKRVEFRIKGAPNLVLAVTIAACRENKSRMFRHQYHSGANWGQSGTVIWCKPSRPRSVIRHT